MAKNEDDKSKSFKSIEDLLKIESSDDEKFDETEAQAELQRLEERKQFLTEYKNKIIEYSKLENADYKLKVLKELVDSGLLMLAALQKEIVDNPTGRDVECVSSLMNSINQTIDNINKIDFFKEKIRLEDEKVQIKKLQKSEINGNITQQNIFMSTNDIVNLIKNPNNILENIKDISQETKIK